MAATSRGSLGAVTVIGAAVAAIAPAEPTGLEWWDVVLNGAVGAVFVLAGAKSPRSILIIAAALAAAASGTAVWAIAAWLGLVAAVAGGTLLDHRDPLLSGFAAGLTVQALLRLPDAGFFGLQSLVAGVAIGLVLVAGYHYSGHRTRRRVRVIATAGLVAAVGVAVVGFAAVMGARSDVDLGVNAARRGLDAARAGDAELVTQEVTRAQVALASAESKLSGPATYGLRFLPIAAQNHAAVLDASRQGVAVAGEAVDAVVATDVDQITLQAGALDLDVLTDAAPRLASVVDTLDSAMVELEAADSPWILPTVEGRIDDLVDEIDELLPEARVAAEAAAVVPAMAGAEGPRHYFVIFGTAGESRELGGFMGSWAFVRFEDGSPTLVDSGRYQELESAAAESGFDASSVSTWYERMARVTRFPQNVTSSPDVSVVAGVVRAVFGDAFDEPIDGVVYLDQWALIDLLGIVGEISIPGREEPLTPADAEDYFFREQYETVGSDRTELFDELAEAASAILVGFEDIDLPGPEELGRILGPAARAGRLQVVTFDDEENAFLEHVRLQRSFLEAGDSTDDFVALVQANGTASKLDIYLSRDASYSVTVDREGRLTGRMRVELRSDVPDDAPAYTVGGEQYAATNLVLLSLYTPHDLVGVTVNGVAADPGFGPEYGKQRYLVEVPVPPAGETQVAEFEIEGLVDPSDGYTLEWWHQPLVNDDSIALAYEGPDGTAAWQGELTENRILSSDQ